MNTNEIMSAMIFGDGGASKIEELSTDGGSTDAGKVLVVGDNGKIAASDLSVGEGEVAIDKTLSVNGAAADAKETGDAITALNGSLGDVRADLSQISVAIPSTNMLDPDAIIEGKYIKLDGTEANGTDFAHTGFIPVSTGQHIILANNGDGGIGVAIRQMRFVTAYDATKTALQDKGLTYVRAYDVPSDVAYIIISMTPKEQLTDASTRINNSYYALPFEQYGETYKPVGYDRVNEISEIKQSTNWLDKDAIGEGYINLNGQLSRATAYKHTGFIPVSEGETVVFGFEKTICQTRFITAYDSNKTVISESGAEYASSYTVPSGVDYIVISTIAYMLTQPTSRVNKSTTLLPYEPCYWVIPNGYSTLQSVTERVVSTNLLDTNTATVGKMVNLSGTESIYITMVHTSYIKVSGNEKIYLVNDGKTVNDCNFRYVTAYDINRSVLPDKGQEYGTLYTVPSGVAFIICTVKKSYYDAGKLAINRESIKPYEPYYDELQPKGVKANTDYRLNMTDYPLSTMPEYMLNLLSYRPLCELEKGYICLVADDGGELLNTYTIPMLLSKDVPATFALMRTSNVMQNTSDINIVKNAIENGGCSVAQHGSAEWNKYSEKELNDFFDAEKDFFDSVGIEVKGAVCPSHYITKVISALAGGRFGVVRSGYNGMGEVSNYYEYYTSGARSNLFALSSFNVIDHAIDTHQNIIDYAIANKKIIIEYWHDNSLTEEHKSTLEGIIDYAKQQGLTFCTLGDIPYLR